METIHQTVPHHWAILGGGVMGISLAEQLVARGQRVTIVEAGSQLGGLATSWTIGDIEWDKFYHVILMSDSRLRGMLERVELDHEIDWVTTKTGFYSGGKLYSLSNSWEFLNFPPLTLIEKLRLGATIFYASKIKNWRRLEQIPVTRWLETLSGTGTFRKIWLPLLKAKLGSAFDRTSAAFIWAYISRMYKARRSGLKTEMFGYVPGGYARIMHAFERYLIRLGVEIRYDSLVRHVAAEQDGSVRVTLSTGETSMFDRVISTLPSETTSKLCPELGATEHQQLKSIEYLGVICMSLLLKEPISPFYVTNITDDWVPMTGIIEMSAVVKAEQFGSRTLVYLPKYLPSGDTGLNDSDEVVSDRFLAALEKMYPNFSRSSVIASKVARAKKVMAIPTLGYSQHLPPIRTSVHGFYALNSAHITSGTLNVNESIGWAETKFNEVVWPDFMGSSVPAVPRPVLAN